jgi:hypothetical protein
MSNTANVDVHEPDPWFREYLAGQLQQELRRGRRVGQVRQATIVLVALVVGSSVGVASAQIRQNAQRDSVLEAAQMKAGIDETQLSAARVSLALAQKKFDVGAAGRDAVLEAYSLMRAAEVEFEVDALNIEEIRATKASPRDDLNSPLVSGRDFVKSRLQLRLSAQQQRVQSLKEQVQEQQRRFDAGAADRIAVLESKATLDAAQAELALLARKIQLREQYLTKQMSFEAASKSIEELDLRNQYQLATGALQIASERLALLEKRKTMGAAEDMEVLRAQLDVRVHELEVRNLANRLSAKRRE